MVIEWVTYVRGWRKEAKVCILNDSALYTDHNDGLGHSVSQSCYSQIMGFSPQNQTRSGHAAAAIVGQTILSFMSCTVWWYSLPMKFIISHQPHFISSHPLFVRSLPSLVVPIYCCCTCRNSGFFKDLNCSRTVKEMMWKERMLINKISKPFLLLLIHQNSTYA